MSAAGWLEEVRSIRPRAWVTAILVGTVGALGFHAVTRDAAPGADQDSASAIVSPDALQSPASAPSRDSSGASLESAPDAPDQGSGSLERGSATHEGSDPPREPVPVDEGDGGKAAPRELDLQGPASSEESARALVSGPGGEEGVPLPEQVEEPPRLVSASANEGTLPASPFVESSPEAREPNQVSQSTLREGLLDTSLTIRRYRNDPEEYIGTLMQREGISP